MCVCAYSQSYNFSPSCAFMGQCGLSKVTSFPLLFFFIFALCGGDYVSYSFKASILLKWGLENLKKQKNLQLLFIRNETRVFLIGSVMSFQETLL